MKIRKSFMIRWLMTFDHDQNENSVIDIEHIQTGEKRRVESLEQANHWMRLVSSPSSEKEDMGTNG